MQANLPANLSAAESGPTFPCSICEEPATEICTYCTKDACSNHRCEKCNRCSDCCRCELERSRK